MICRTLTAASMLAALVTLPAASTSGAGLAPLCHGERATIVGDGQNKLRGTAGDDVIVTNSAERTYAGDGDDLICVTGQYDTDQSPAVEAGEGNDRVYVRVAREDADLYAVLG